MNLILSGTVPDLLRSELVTLSNATTVALVNSMVCCLENVSSTVTVRTAVDRICLFAKVDYAFIDPELSLDRFNLLVLDMDSTLITIECIDEIADYAGKKREVAEITAATMRGEITDFSESLQRRLSYLAGVKVSVLQKVYEERLRFTSGARELIAAAHKNGLKTILVSGGFTYFADRIARELGLTAAYANRLEVIDGKLTGNIVGQVIGPIEKASIVSQMLKKYEVTRSRAIVIGDGSNDIPMMNLVDASFAFHAKPSVNSVARYLIRYGSLITVLNFLGAYEVSSR